MTRDEIIYLMARGLAYHHGAEITGPGRHRASDEYGWAPDAAHKARYALANYKKHVGAAEFALSSLEAAGFVIVPKEPTPEMIAELGSLWPYNDEQAASVYRAMLAARPGAKP